MPPVYSKTFHSAGRVEITTNFNAVCEKRETTSAKPVMKIRKQREIVIEFERVQMVRKKARTHLLVCRECRRETDFVPLGEAAKLFGTNAAQLFAFIKTNRSHFETGADGELFICLISLLARIKAKTSISGIKMIGE